MTKTERKRQARSNPRRIRLHFLGATQTVTGSLHFFEYSDGQTTKRFFLDAGLNQETPSFNHQNRLPAGMKPSDVDFGIFSHTHIDHIGFFPKLCKDGFKGTVYATPATRDLTTVLLPDSGYLQEEEAKRATRRAATKKSSQGSRSSATTSATTAATANAAGNRSKSPSPSRFSASSSNSASGNNANSGATAAEAASDPRVIHPLYTEADAQKCLSQIQPVEYDTPLQIADGIVVRFTHASHLLGAAVVTLELGKGSTKRRVVFTGDLGRPNMPILKDLAVVKQADYIICEGTYGNKLHQKRDRLPVLADIINRAYERAMKGDAKHGRGIIVIPAFAVGRVQAVLFDLRQLMAEKRIPNIPVFVDSPMAIKATAIHRNHTELYNRKAAQLFENGTDLFTTPRYAEVKEWQQSERLDQPASEPIIVVGSSGMASGGRIMRHLEKRVPHAQNTVVFIGYQGLGTTGRQLVTPKIQTAKIAGKSVKVRATIEHMSDYSGHADYEDIIRWFSRFDRAPKNVFLVHGDPESLEALKEHIEQRLNWNVSVPRYREVIDLE